MSETTNSNGEQGRTIYSFSPFGYEGSIVSVETDLRRGIPAVDIVGLADSQIKETRERIRAAFRNQGIEFPAERVLMSLSPADLKKEGAGFDLPMALSVLNAKYNYKGEPVLAIGELELNGHVRPVRGVHAAVSNAMSAGIRNFIVPNENMNEALSIPGAKVIPVSNLSEAHEALLNNKPFIEQAVENTPKTTVKFNSEAEELTANLNLNGLYDAARAIEIAVAGKHNILFEGVPGCGKTMLLQHLIPALTPELTDEESQKTSRIWSIAGLMRPTDGLIKDAPFRMPHQTATIEGMFGGGTGCRPGEISLAQNGTLFLDEASEFRSSVLQMLRVPLETGSIALSRAGRSTVYPANFQLAMAVNPCPCGCNGSHDRICLCSAKSIELYWKKFSDPLLDRIEIKQHVERNPEDTRMITLSEMQQHIENAFKIQRENPNYNSKLNSQEIYEKCKLNEECGQYFEEKAKQQDFSPRQRSNTLKVALTIANMDTRREIGLNDLKEAFELVSPLSNKPQEYKHSLPDQLGKTEVKQDLKLNKEPELAFKDMTGNRIEPEEILETERNGNSDYSISGEEFINTLGEIMEMAAQEEEPEAEEEFVESQENRKEEDSIYNEPGSLFFELDDEIDSVQSPVKNYGWTDIDDIYITPEQLTKSEMKRDQIILPVLNGKESGMYKAFNTFAERGVFDILGQEVDLKETKQGGRISEEGWTQLHAAMNIYRSKEFETFRYVLVDRHNGEIRDQLTVCAHMPNVCKVSSPENTTLKQVIERAEETDSLIVAVHNHPSGNTEPSSYDTDVSNALMKVCTRIDGLQRFAGHIILDHDTYNIWKPNQGWQQYKDIKNITREDELKNKDFIYSDLEVNNQRKLASVAEKINDTNNWNDDCIPVVFSDADNKVTGVKLYDKSFFFKDSQFIRNEFQFSGLEAGAIRAYPVITEAFMNKLNGADQIIFEETMKEHVINSAFSDAVFPYPNSTITEKYNCKPGINLYDPRFTSIKDKIEIKDTWTHQENLSLYEKFMIGKIQVITNDDEKQHKIPVSEVHRLKKASGMGY